MRRFIVIPLLLFPLLISAQSYYGTNYGGNEVANTRIGYYAGATGDYRFRAEYTGSVTQIRVSLMYDIASGYGGGTGGTLKISLETDDGSSDHFPSGIVLTSVTDNNPLGHGGKGCQCLYTFDKPANLTAGTLYHLRFTNPDANPIINYVSINNLFVDSPSSIYDRMPTGSITELALLFKTGTYQWSILNNYTPIFSLYYLDGTMQGQSYLNAASVSGLRSINGINNKVRSNIAVSGTNKTVNKVWVRLKKTSGTDNLTLRLEDGVGTLIEESTVSASNIITTMSWVSATFSTTHILLSGSKYNLILSTGSGTTYQTFPLQDGGYNYGFNYMFHDGYLEYTTNGSTWNNSGTSEKVQMYFETLSSDTLKYLNSTIENATSSFLDMTFSLILADTIPSSAAFNVKVNGINRDINSVAIIGNKVRLILSSPVVYNDIVTVTYNLPSKGWLRPVSGEKASSFFDQPVTNKCLDPAKPNQPPVPTITFGSSGFSGFVYEIDASESKDPEGEILSYEWNVPSNLAVSSTSSSKIRFLAPMVSSSQNFDISLKVSDGLTDVVRGITININPYKPEMGEARINEITFSGYQLPDIPGNITDDDLTTKWSVNGDNQWLLFKLAVPFKISHLNIAFLSGQTYESFFDIYASKDNLAWESILIKAASCNFSGDIHTFDFPATKTGTEYSYIKLIGHGNSINTWNNFSEFKVYGMLSDNPGYVDSEKKNVVIYPNPAKDYFKISIEESTFEPDLVQLIDLSGKMVFEDLLETGIKTVQVPSYVKSGIYIVEIKSGNLILDAQKLVINRSSVN